MTQNQIPENMPPFVYEDDMTNLANLILNDPNHPKAKEIKRIAEELEKRKD